MDIADNSLNVSLLALHTAARRYCYDHYPGVVPAFREAFQYANLLYQYDESLPWPEREAEIVGGNSRVLGSLLKKVESVEPDDFADVDDLYRFLLAGARNTAEEEIPEQDVEWADAADRRAMAHYLDGFRWHLEARMQGGRLPVSPLPYRRYLTPQQALPVWATVERVWQLSRDGMWYPMLPPGCFMERADVAAFDQLVLYWNVGLDGLRSILSSLSSGRAFKLVRGNAGDQCELDVAFLELPVVGSDEIYWTTRRADCLLYLSHESTVTVAGEGFLHALKEAWPGWRDGLSYEVTGRWPDQLSERLNF